MGIITKEVFIFKNRKTFNWYDGKGYEFTVKDGDRLSSALVKVSDLHPFSRARILAKCESCGSVREISFNQYRDICSICNNKLSPTVETKRKQSKTHKGLQQGEKNPSWKGGKPKCKQCGITLATWRGELCKKCFLMRDQSGPKNSAWRSDLTISEKEKNIKDRKNILVYRWVKAVKEIYNNTCDICGITDVIMHAHHLFNWVDNPDKRYDIKNGVCLCRVCHVEFHKNYGKRNNTEEQYLEYKRKKKC